MKEVLVVGFGAVGAIYSYILKHGGKANVTCVARGNYATTLEGGIHIRSRTYGSVRGWKPDRLFRTVAEAADMNYSHVIVTTKALPEVVPTHELLAPLLRRDVLHPLPTFVILQNGLFVEKDLHEAIKQLGREEPKVISTALWIGTNLLDDNVIDHCHRERLNIGMYRPKYQADVTNSPHEAIILNEFADLFEHTGSIVHVLPEVQRVKFRKNFWNAALGSCCTLTRLPLQAFIQTPELESQVVPQLAAIMHEILDIGRAMGLDEQALPSDVVDNILEPTIQLHKDPQITHRPSMLVDLELGRPMEVEAVVGELIKIANEYHVHAPRLELIYTLLKVLQNKVRG